MNQQFIVPNWFVAQLIRRLEQAFAAAEMAELVFSESLAVAVAHLERERQAADEAVAVLQRESAGAAARLRALVDGSKSEFEQLLRQGLLRIREERRQHAVESALQLEVQVRQQPLARRVSYLLPAWLARVARPARRT